VRRSAIVILALGFGLSACASAPGAGGSPSLDPESPVGHDVQSPGPDPIGNGAVREEPDPTIVQAHPTGIAQFAIGPDGRTVVVTYSGGNQTCFGLQRVDVAVLADGTLSITVWEGTHPEAVDMICTMEAILKSTVVTLDEPVIVDGNQPDAPAAEPELALQPQIVSVQNGVLDAIPVVLTGFAITPDGLRVTAQWYGGVPECYGVAVASIEKSVRPLVVSISEGRMPGSDVCIDIAMAKGVEFTLDTPLIRDGSLAR
jgi:hypothetical protein